jgi:DNA repair protein RecN (Recombination protein N)
VVASKGNQHIHISKKTDNDTTYTEINVLAEEEKKSVLATMIAGEITPHALKQAEELMRQEGD